MIHSSSLPFKVKFTGNPVTANGGLVVFLDMIERYRILKALPDLAHRHQGWCDGQMILALMLLNIAGYDRVGDIDRLESDGVLARLVRRSERRILGLSRRTINARFRGGRSGTFPASRSIHDWLKQFHDEAAGRERVSGTAYIPVPSARYGPLTVAWKRLIAVAVREAKINSITIDVDATIIRSGKREARHTYRSATGSHPFERGYQPMMAFSPELGMILHQEMRDGNVPASTDVPRFLEETLELLPDAITHVMVRSDCAGYQEELIRFCNRPEARSARLQRFGIIDLVTGAPLCDSARGSILDTVPKDWTSRDKSGFAYAEVPHATEMAGRMRQDEELRYVASRVPIDEFGVGEDEAMIGSWGGETAWRLRLVATNIPAPYEDCDARTSPVDRPCIDKFGIFDLANMRCGRSEDAHRTLKSEYAGGMLPSGYFGANGCWLMLACLSTNIVALARRVAFGGGQWLWVRMKRVRAVLINVSGYIVQHAGRVVLVLASAGSREIKLALARLEHLHPI